MEGIDTDHRHDARPGEQCGLDGHGADEDGAGGALGIEDGEDIVGEFGDSPLLAVASGFAVAGKVESDHFVIVREGAVLAVLEGAVGQPAVNEDYGGICRAGYRVGDGDAVNETGSSMEHGSLLIVVWGTPQRKGTACGGCFQEQNITSESRSRRATRCRPTKPELLYRREEFAGGDGGAFFCGDGEDSTGAIGLQLVLHLHGFHHYDALARDHCVAGRG